MAPNSWEPATQAERHKALDIIRGVALFGVLLVNLLTGLRLTAFLVGCGVGAAIQADRAASRGVNIEGFLLRRFLIVVVIGLTHLLLIWNGDILALYGVCGLMLVPLLRLPPARCGLWAPGPSPFLILFRLGSACARPQIFIFSLLVGSFREKGRPDALGRGASDSVLWNG